MGSEKGPVTARAGYLYKAIRSSRESGRDSGGGGGISGQVRFRPVFFAW